MINKEISLSQNGSMPYARITSYFHEKSEELVNDPRTTLLICPGGGYCFTSAREAEPIAVRYYSMGFNTAVLWYSVAPARYPVALNEAGEAMQYLYDNADAFMINRDKIVIMGFSAGGHLAASYSCFWKKKGFIRPAAALLCYPVITSGPYAHEDSFRKLLDDRYDDIKDDLSLENCVTSDNPKTFLWTTFTDDCVPAENTFMFAAALRKLNISTELHMFEKGAHGLALADENTFNPAYPESIQPECVPWFALSITWLKNI